MAMLAEPRRKQKLSINPQGTSWSNDDSKFGQKMLERMGWSKGKGLGAKEDGRVDHVRISLKNDQKGVGASKNHSDNWIAHQDDFNSLLESLNQGHGEGGDNSPSTDKQVASLEKKSQSSRSRVHYGKFTKGKDLSSRSDHELKCIFGKRGDKSVSGENTPTVESAESSSSEESKMDESHGFKTIKSTSNLQEYFAQKMAALKGQQTPDSGDGKIEGSDETEDVENNKEEVEEAKSKRKKKKKKKKSKDLDTEEGVEITESVNNDISDGEERPCLGYERIKESKQGKETVTAGIEEVDSEEEKRDRKRKKEKKCKKRKKSDEPPEEEESEEQPLKKKKKKKNRQV